jgi:phage replication-related protein YjqB (UPF0714/DUF867 family)
MVDKYRNFSELSWHEREGQDYEVVYRRSDSIFLVMAVHGGAIEPGTSEIADAIAGKNFSFYTLKGIKEHGNADLHIKSTCFDEPQALSLLKRSRIAITVHGRKREGQTIYVGGLHLQLKERIIYALEAAGLKVTHQDFPSYKGLNFRNLCNLGQSEAGVQLEISKGLRSAFFKPLGGIGRQTRSFDTFVGAVRNVLLRWQKEYHNAL